MACPQKENGYTAIANEIMGALMAYRIPGEQMQCLLLIIRKTYGYNKKWDMISNSQFVEFTGLKKPSVCRAIRELVDKNIVYKNANNRIPSYCFNKNYSNWKVLTKKLTAKIVSKKVNERPKSLAKKRPTKDINTKDKYSEDSFEYQLSKLLLDLILKRNDKYKRPDLQKWAVNIDRMARLDNRDPDDIENVIKWCQADVAFWQNNILSTLKLREHFDQLYMKMEKTGPAPVKRKVFTADDKSIYE